jgi:hypothetical protein
MARSHPPPRPQPTRGARYARRIGGPGMVLSPCRVPPLWAPVLRLLWHVKPRYPCDTPAPVGVRHLGLG